METIFINNENGKTSEPHRFRLYFTDKLDLRRSKAVALANSSIYYTWENINSKYNYNKFKISGPTWSQTFDLADGSYEIPHIQDYFLKMTEKHEPKIGQVEHVLLHCIFKMIIYKIQNFYTNLFQIKPLVN